MTKRKMTGHAMRTGKSCTRGTETTETNEQVKQNGNKLEKVVSCKIYTVVDNQRLGHVAIATLR